MHEFDIVCFYEKHLDYNVTNEQINIEGFSKIICKDRNCYGDGIAIYLSNSIQARRPIDLEPVNVECIWMDRKPYLKFLLVLCISPTNQSFHLLEKKQFLVFIKNNELSERIIILGDLNVNFFKHPTITFKTRYSPTQQFDKHYTRTNVNYTFHANSHTILR